MVASIALPRLMRVGAGASRLLPEVLGQLGLSRPFVVTDPYLAGSGRTDTLLERLTKAGAKATIFSETVPDPTVASVEAALAALQAGDFDCVVGFGGVRLTSCGSVAKSKGIPRMSEYSVLKRPVSGLSS